MTNKINKVVNENRLSLKVPSVHKEDKTKNIKISEEIHTTLKTCCAAEKLSVRLFTEKAIILEILKYEKLQKFRKGEITMKNHYRGMWNPGDPV